MPRPRVYRNPKLQRRAERSVKRRNLPNWTGVGMFAINIPMKERVLAVMMMPMAGMWECTAVDTSAKATCVADVFDEHGHKVLGKFRDIEKAVEACEKYAREWIKGQQKIEACACKEIAKHAKLARIDAEFEPSENRPPTLYRKRKKAA